MRAARVVVSMTSAAQEIAPRKSRIAATAAAVVLFWLAAVLLVTAAGSLLAQEAPWMSVAAKTVRSGRTRF